MADIQMNQSQNILVDVTDILKKLITFQERKNFALENIKKISII